MTSSQTDPFNLVYTRDPSIVARKIAGEMILVPVRQNVGDLESIYLLNETALFAWERFDGKNTLAEIRSQMTIDFEVDDGQAGEDLLGLAAHLEKVGAIRKT